MELHFLRLVRALADVAESPVVMHVAKQILEELDPQPEQIEEPEVTAPEPTPEPAPAPVVDTPAEPAPAVETPFDEEQDNRLNALEAQVGGIAQSVNLLVERLSVAPSDAPATV